MELHKLRLLPFRGGRVGLHKLIILLSDRLGGTSQAKTPPLSGRLGGAFLYEKTTHNRDE